MNACLNSLIRYAVWISPRVVVKKLSYTRKGFNDFRHDFRHYATLRVDMKAHQKM